MKLLRQFLRFVAGYVAYAVRGRTPVFAYVAMRKLYALTDGRFNDAALAVARRLRPRTAQGVEGFLGSWSAAQVADVAGRIQRSGIADLGRALPPDLRDQLEAFARCTPALPLGGTAPQLYRSDAAAALRYDFAPADILQLPAARRIALDGTLAAIAAAYFGCAAQFDFVAMWWTTGTGTRDYSGAAQQFHYDMDRLFFLKFFFYLTDVDADSGPHVYVAGSHRRKPAALREDRRFADAEVAGHYLLEQVRVVTGPRGTTFAADTRGLHKGMPVVRGERLVLQVEYTISRFGQNY